MALRSDDDDVFDEDEIIEPLDLDEDEDEQPDAAIPDEVVRVREAGRELMQVCVNVGGTITGEHGVGLDKRELLPLVFSEADMNVMLAVRTAFDPLGLCNPGKIIPIDLEQFDGPLRRLKERPKGWRRARPVFAHSGKNECDRLVLPIPDRQLVSGMLQERVAPAWSCASQRCTA